MCGIITILLLKDVGRNALLLPEDSEALQKLQGALSNLTQLKLAYLEQTWEQVVAIASTLPRLEYLSVAANGISRIGALPAEVAAFRTLQSIDLSGNPIAEWSHIMEFARLPNLQGLNVAECKITGNFRVDLRPLKHMSQSKLKCRQKGWTSNHDYSHHS